MQLGNSPSSCFISKNFIMFFFSDLKLAFYLTSTTSLLFLYHLTYSWDFFDILKLAVVFSIPFYYFLKLMMIRWHSPASKIARWTNTWRVPPHLPFGCGCYVPKHYINKQTSGMLLQRFLSPLCLRLFCLRWERDVSSLCWYLTEQSTARNVLKNEVQSR